jgi:hypothetical protein
MELFKDMECCGCRWCMNSCWIKAVTEELGHMILAFFAMTKIKTNFMDTVVVNDKEGVLFCWMR